MAIIETPYSPPIGGKPVSLFMLLDEGGMRAHISNFGGILEGLYVPDRHGKLSDIVLGKNSLEDYRSGHPYFGSTTGRVAGRIGNAAFSLDGVDYKLAANNGPNCLHGGLEGLDKKIWEADILYEGGIEKLSLSLTDSDGSNDFPGTLECTVTYAILEGNTLEITYTATTDRATPLNLTNHSYFNLKGHDCGDVLGHTVQIFSDSVASVDMNSTLTGRREPVQSGYNDYRKGVRLADLEKLEVGNADIHYFLDGGRTPTPKLAAIVSEAESGRIMEVLTTEPGVQFYAGNSLSLPPSAPEIGKGGVIYPPHGGLCLETQDYPDSVNFPEMGGAVLHPGVVFRSTTLYRFKLD